MGAQHRRGHLVGLRRRNPLRGRVPLRAHERAGQRSRRLSAGLRPAPGPAPLRPGAVRRRSRAGVRAGQPRPLLPGRAGGVLRGGELLRPAAGRLQRHHRGDRGAGPGEHPLAGAAPAPGNPARDHVRQPPHRRGTGRLPPAAAPDPRRVGPRPGRALLGGPAAGGGAAPGRPGSRPAWWCWPCPSSWTRTAAPCPWPPAPGRWPRRCRPPCTPAGSPCWATASWAA